MKLPKDEFNRHKGLLVIDMPEGLERVPTGPMQIGDGPNAWPGYFLRGDHVMSLEYLFLAAIKQAESRLAKKLREELDDLLRCWNMLKDTRVYDYRKKVEFKK